MEGGEKDRKAGQDTPPGLHRAVLHRTEMHELQQDHPQHKAPEKREQGKRSPSVRHNDLEFIERSGGGNVLRRWRRLAEQWAEPAGWQTQSSERARLVRLFEP